MPPKFFLCCFSAQRSIKRLAAGSIVCRTADRRAADRLQNGKGIDWIWWRQTSVKVLPSGQRQAMANLPSAQGSCSAGRTFAPSDSGGTVLGRRQRRSQAMADSRSRSQAAAVGRRRSQAAASGCKRQQGRQAATGGSRRSRMAVKTTHWPTVGA